MPPYHKIVWNEGMFLTPQHFQQQDHYYEGLLDFRMRSVLPFGWGLIGLEINQEALENGNFILVSCQGILPGGTPVDIPRTDESPLSRPIEEHFGPSLSTLDVHLAIPVERPGKASCSLESRKGPHETRYSREFVRVVDENTGDSENEQEIPVAKKNFKIMFGGELLDDHDCLKIAELGRSPSGAIVLHDDYIPPCLSISASPQLMKMLGRLMEVLTTKSNELSDQFRQREGGLYEFGAADVSNLWFLHTINSFIPEVYHFYRMQEIHPEELFRLLLRFAGTITAFNANIRPMDLPGYNHKNPAHCFGYLDTVIREFLQMLAPVTMYKLIPLRKVSESIYEATIDDYLFAPSYRFYLAVKGEGSQREMIDGILQRVKIASAGEINLLIGKALRGIALIHLPSPPAAIPKKLGYCYFSLDLRGDYWVNIQQSKSLAIYVPPGFMKVELELMAAEQ
ncbi:MAG: type VI secretion system baseplate subunit TssK [bacterium]|nr:type VI secretion system baseplate subunit TssK [bacterium]